MIKLILVMFAWHELAVLFLSRSHCSLQPISAVSKLCVSQQQNVYNCERMKMNLTSYHMTNNFFQSKEKVCMCAEGVRLHCSTCGNGVYSACQLAEVTHMMESMLDNAMVVVHRVDVHLCRQVRYCFLHF